MKDKCLHVFLLLISGILLLASVSLFFTSLHLQFKSTLMTLFMILTFCGGVGLIWLCMTTYLQWKDRIAYILYCFIVVEMGMQVMGWVGVIPGINTFKHRPYGRVYWTKEGFSNTSMNRYGWHYPEFRLNSQSTKIALIGDSFIQALQIDPSKHMGQRIQNEIGLSNDSTIYDFFGFGISGIGPAQYFEILKYAHQHFNIDEAILFLYLGNDFSNVNYKVQTDYPPSKYMYYQLTSSNTIRLHPESKLAQSRFQTELEQNHDSLIVQWASIGLTHWMTFHTAMSIVKQFNHFVSNSNDSSEQESTIEDELLSLGLHPYIFDRDETETATESFTIVKKILEQTRDYTIGNKIKLYIVTIPALPKRLLLSDESQWSPIVERYDFSKPEQIITDWCNEHQVSVLPMLSHMQEQQLSLNTIQSLYFMDGNGHFTEAGHTFYAQTIYNAFYQN